MRWASLIPSGRMVLARHRSDALAAGTTCGALLDYSLDDRVPAQQEGQAQQVLVGLLQFAALGEPADLDDLELGLLPVALSLVILGQHAEGQREDQRPVTGKPIDQPPV